MLTRAITVVWILVIAAIAIPLLESSEAPDIWRYSYLRLAIIVIAALVLLYLCAGLASSSLSRLNGIVLWNISLVAIVLELGLRLAPTALPPLLSTHLPQDAQRRIAEAYGGFTEGNLRGGGVCSIPFGPEINWPNFPLW